MFSVFSFYFLYTSSWRYHSNLSLRLYSVLCVVFQAARSKSSSRKAGNWREKALFYRIPPSRADVNQAHPARRSRGRQTTSGLSQRGFYGALFVMHCAAGDNKARVSQWNVLDSLQLRITIQKRIRERFMDGGVIAVR